MRSPARPLMPMRVCRPVPRRWAVVQRVELSVEGDAGVVAGAGWCMSRRSLQIPSIVRARASAAGPAGERWLADLPDTIAAVEAGWSVVVGEQLGGGTAAFVARAVTAAGDAAVVRIAVPEPGFPRLVRTLAVAEGRASARRRGIPETGRSSPARPTSPKATACGGSGASTTELATLRASARSAAGSARRTPPTVESRRRGRRWGCGPGVRAPP